jgi:hypothetical protein
MKPNNLVIGGGLLVIGLLIVRSILKGTGIINNPAEPVTWDTTKPPVKNSTTCKSSYTAEQIRKGIFSQWARQIFEAKGIFNDNEAAVNDIIFNKIKTRGDMYLLGQYFALQHQSEIISYLKGFLNAEELTPIIKKINSLPCNK